jgi:hypothetical protein
MKKNAMKAITIRGIDRELERELKKKAVENGDSINTTLLKLLREALLLIKPKYYREFHDLDNLAGTWTEEDEKEFNLIQEGFEQIDKELWR